MPKMATLGVVIHKIIRIVFSMLKNKHHRLFVDFNEFSESPLYTYNFTAEEQTGGNQIHSLAEDLTGDGIEHTFIRC